MIEQGSRVTLRHLVTEHQRSQFAVGKGIAYVDQVLIRCPATGCTSAAYRVRRSPGSFPGWLDEISLWHAEDTEELPPATGDDD